MMADGYFCLFLLRLFFHMHKSAQAVVSISHNGDCPFCVLLCDNFLPTLA